MPPHRLLLRTGLLAVLCLVLASPQTRAGTPVASSTATPPARPAVLSLALSPDSLPEKGRPEDAKLDGRLMHLSQGDPALSVDDTGLRMLDGRVQVRIVHDGASSARAQQLVEALGGEVTGALAVGGLLQAWVPPSSLETLARDESIARVGPPADAVSFGALQAGDYTSEGLAAIGASAWHAAGYDGAGVRVGIIETGFLGYASLLGSELPSAVTARNFVDGEALTEVEGASAAGAACAEIVHDVAPGATLYLARVQTDVDLAEAVQWLMGSGVDVIATSLGWLNATPGDGSGYLADLVADAREAGILWVSSAGDLRLHHWGGTFSDPDGDDLHNFGPSIEICDYLGAIPSGVPLEAYLRWDDWTAVTNDFDLFLLRYDAASTTWNIIDSSIGYQNGGAGQTPTEAVQAVSYGETTYYGLGIQRWDATRAVNFELFAGPYYLYEPVYARSLPNLPDAPLALSVSAVDAAAPYVHEPYSSEGPTNGPGGAASGGLAKPDLAAYDNVSTYTYGAQVPSRPFEGARAAAPHVAGAAALVLDAYPSYSPSQIQAFVEGRAVDMGAIGEDTVYGHGRLSLGAPPSNPPTTPNVTPSSTAVPGPSDTPLTPTATRTRTPTPTPTPDRRVRLPLALDDWYTGRRFPVDDPYFGYQWGLTQIEVQDAWPLGSGTGVTVAIVDSGVDMNHPDLAAKLTGGYDVADGDSWPQDSVGHGTHVAGIVAAVSGNGIGVAGVGWDTLIMPVKVSGSDGMIWTSDVADGIVGAVETGARVINLSLGSENPSQALQSATDYAHSRGVLVVASAGNCGDPSTCELNGCSKHNPVIYPAANPHVLAVGATTPYGTRGSFSEYGSFVDVAAPGVDILSTMWDNTYDYASGTSMASPFVAGLASLVWSGNPALSADQVAQIIAGTATDLGPAGRDDEFGWGLINARAAVSAAYAGQAMAASAATDAPPEPSAARALAQEARESDAPVRPGAVLVRPGAATSAAALPGLLGLADVQVESESSPLGYVRLRVPEGQERDIAARLMAEGAVAFAEPDYLLTLWR